jgi:hypothetical protein
LPFIHPRCFQRKLEEAGYKRWRETYYGTIYRRKTSRDIISIVKLTLDPQYVTGMLRKAGFSDDVVKAFLANCCSV